MNRETRNIFEELNMKIVKGCKDISEIKKNIPLSYELLDELENQKKVNQSLKIYSIIGGAVSGVSSYGEKLSRNILKKINQLNKNEANIKSRNGEWSKLLKNNSMDEVVKKVKFNSFSIQHYLNNLKNEKRITFEEICIASNHKMSYIKPVFNTSKKSQRNPNRDCILGLAFAFNLNTYEINDLLKEAGFNQLYLRNKRDLIIAKGLMDSINIKEVNNYLEQYDCSRIGNLDNDEGFLEAK